MLLKLARQSLWHRRGTVLMTLLSLTISIALLLGIDHLRLEAKRSFTSTVSGTDLIVGARSGQLNLLLYSVFRLGNATNNISYQHYQQLSSHPQVAWAIPMALGDSHRGFRVIGTNGDYFRYFRYGQQQSLSFAKGEAFSTVYQVVLGATVAEKLGYQLGDQIILSHGVGAVSFTQHKDQPFAVVGILAATGTPVDQSVHVSLESIEAIHLGWQGGAPGFGKKPKLNDTQLQQLEPKVLTAFMLGLKSKVATFAIQRQINEFKAEPLTAILPGAALAELWQMLAMVENMLLLVTLLVLIAALIGMVTTLLAAMKERQREMAILRAVGARPWQLFCLIQLEVFCISLASIGSALLLLCGSLAVLQPLLSSSYGLVISWLPWHGHTAALLAALLALALLLGAIPSYLTYRQSLAQGLTVRL
ncbi:ABC transporter permease [Rheinheimera sp. 4Y26]|uniref:ABC transporter permease n=1 Tax=Rheinheimera sp. 4Y26 TaxID=2977811 RepID=UPI0021B0A7ED|nr:FtsX-like permease family protein [Rheinheimera sp. 4Y26]MCT6700878.1 ABC transporter permease [Rheinheimera sp. 4Y26]